MEKVAQQAGKAAPAVAIAGALVAAPQASQALAASANPVAVTGQSPATAPATTHATHATLDSVEARTVTVTAAKQARHAAMAQSTTYRVVSGDTLSKIANRFFHNNDWQYLYAKNANTVSNPDMIYVGEVLTIPASAPAHYTVSSYVPRHAKPAAPTTRTVPATTSRSTSSGSSAAGGSAHGGGTMVTQSTPQGHYSCSGLEQIWKQAGGNPAHALIAAEIAMAESGGNPSAISPTDDFGLWQINASNGALATLNPFQNAKSAVVLSHNGTNWGAWTTFTSGRYAGKC